MQNPKTDIGQPFISLMIFWLALVMSQVMLLVMLYFLRPEVFDFDPGRPIPGPNGVVVAALGVISLSITLLSFVLRKKFVERSVSEQNIGLIQTGLIIGCALCESVSLIGFVLAFSFGYQYFFVFSIGGLIAMLLHFPRRRDLLAATFKSDGI